MTFDEILERITITPAGCWEFSGAHLPSGYGSVRFNGRTHVLHKLMWEQKHGPVTQGLQLDHLCRNRGCCNPDHVEPVTQKVNLLRGIGFAAVNSRKTHCDHGHEYTPINTYTSPAGDRRCRTCRKENRRKHYLKSRAA